MVFWVIFGLFTWYTRSSDYKLALKLKSNVQNKLVYKKRNLFYILVL